MASSESVSRHSPTNFGPNDKDATSDESKENGKPEDDESEILPGTKLEDTHSFSDKHGKLLSVTPIIVDFRRLLQNKSCTEVIPGVRCDELILLNKLVFTLFFTF